MGAGVSYAGGKDGAGVYQAIINQMPEHRIYVELFLGMGAALRHKRPAPGGSIGVDNQAAAGVCDDIGIPLADV